MDRQYKKQKRISEKMWNTAIKAELEIMREFHDSVIQILMPNPIVSSNQFLDPVKMVNLKMEYVIRLKKEANEILFAERDRLKDRLDELEAADNEGEEWKLNQNQNQDEDNLN
jgi:hypothetical protein